MRLAAPFLVASALALAFGGAYAADKDKQAKADDEPGFNVLDANNDGKLTKAEAAKDKKLSQQWSEADRNKDGTVTRAEYLMVKGRQDIGSVTDRVRSAVGGDDKASAGSSSSAGSTGKSN